MANQMYIFENVLKDSSDGMAIIIASSIDEAYRLAEERFEENVKDENEGWYAPKVFKLADDTYPHIVSFVYGGD